MKTPIQSLLLGWVFWFAVVSLHAEPAMPEGFSATWADESGLTWRETGTLPVSFTNATQSVKASMKAQGYALRHDIFDKAFPDHRLFLFLKDDEEVTVLLWRIDGKTAGLSWGVTKASDPESSGERAVRSVAIPDRLPENVSTNTNERINQP